MKVRPSYGTWVVFGCVLLNLLWPPVVVWLLVVSLVLLGVSVAVDVSAARRGLR